MADEEKKEEAGPTQADAKGQAQAQTGPTGQAQARGEGGSAAPDAREARIAALEAREKELLDRLARLQADFENFRRRAREDAAQSKTAGKLDLVKTLLPVLDNLDRALAHSDDEGLKLLARHLQGTLASAGLVALTPEGEAFDAKLHEAIAQETREGAKPGTILSVVERGYVLDGKLVRPARVTVAA